MSKEKFDFDWDTFELICITRGRINEIVNQVNFIHNTLESLHRCLESKECFLREQAERDIRKLNKALKANNGKE